MNAETLGTMQVSDARAPLISVVIPAFNRKDDLGPALASVISQDIAELEIIIVDDGSTDGTADVDFAEIDGRIRVVRHLVNRGGGAARNSGIYAAKGQLVALLDSDDEWCPGKLRAQLDALTREGCIERDASGCRVLCDFICSANVLIETNGAQQLHNSMAPGDASGLDHYLMVSGQALQTSTLLLPTALARRIRFRDGLRRHQDWDFVLRLSGAGARLVYLPEAVAIYKLRDDPKRISRQHNRLKATLDWYRTSGAKLTAEARRTYFVRSVLSRDLLKEPLTALQGLWWLATRARGEAMPLLREISKEGLAKLRGKLAAPG